MNRKKLNYLDGKHWIKYSISVWDIKKSKAENSISHPAMFPLELCNRLIEIFTKPGDIVLDPFLGCGSTLVAAKNLARNGIGFEINKQYVDIAIDRLEKVKWGATLENKLRVKQTKLGEINISNDANIGIEIPKEENLKIINDSCHSIPKYVNNNSIDFVLTSPPYWDILRQKRTADYKEIRPYSDDEEDLGNIEDYDTFIDNLGQIFRKINQVLRHKKWCAVVVMDIRKKDRFYPFHCDLAEEITKQGFKFEDIIIWNREKEYNSLKALGYPYVFRVNKVHEYILLFSKK